MATPKTTQAKIDQLRSLYLAGVPMLDIIHQLGISRPTAYKYVRSGPGTCRYEARPDHSVWHEAFDDLTDEAAYWVGMLITDGCIVGNGRRVKLSLQVRDIPTLERFKSFVRTTAPVGKPHIGSATVRFSSPYMCRRLAELNVVPRKSMIAQAPEILLDNRHFWRGVIDGDGSVLPNPLTSPRLSLCGASSAPLLKQFQSACAKRLGKKHSHNIRPDKPRVADLILYGEPALIIGHWLYSGCTPESPAMERKLSAFNDMCAAHGSREKSKSGRYQKRRAPRACST
jgi:hypothetical protein